MIQQEINEKNEVLQLITHRLPVRLLSDITKFQLANGFQDRSKAINRMLEICLIVWKEGSKLKKKPEMLDELYSQMKESGAVEYLMKLPPKELELMYHLVETEYKARFKKGLAKP
jgi:hypothetical protein